MGIFELFALGTGLSMDAFAVSVCKGLSSKKTNIGVMAKCGLWFGSFQALMPLIGYLLGSLFKKQIEAIDHWVAFALLAIIGINMLKEAFVKEEKDDCGCENSADVSVKTMFTMALATSIDALAVGISLSMAGDVNIYAAIAIIGITTCILSALGVKIGSLFGDKFGNKAQVAGGIILIILGLKILLEHLNII